MTAWLALRDGGLVPPHPKRRHLRAAAWEDEERDEKGRWTSGGGGGETDKLTISTRNDEPPAGPKPEFPKALAEEVHNGKDVSDDPRYQQYRVDEKAWEAQMTRAVFMGTITPKDAQGRGYWGFSGHRIEQLPDTLYHVTTGATGVGNEGLRTRDDLGQGGSGHGLGGGPSDLISFTGSKETADAIERATLEFRDVARGEITARDLVENARSGVDADRPYLRDAMGYWQHGWEQGDPVPRALQDAIDREKSGPYNVIGRYMGTEDEVRSFLEKETEKSGWKPDTDTRQSASDALGHEVYGRWYRPATEDEARSQAVDVFKVMSAFREGAGGPLDPLFFSSNWRALAETPRSEIGIVTARPATDRAQGELMEALGEWRTIPDAVSVTSIERAVTAAAAPWEEFYSEDQERGPDGRFTSGGGDRWYHGTNNAFQPGDVLLPASQTGKPAHNYHYEPERANHVYVVKDPKLAKTYGRYVYEVKPRGTTPDPVEGGTHRTPSAVVQQRVRRKGWEEFYSEDQERDEHGRWTSGGGADVASKMSDLPPNQQQLITDTMAEMGYTHDAALANAERLFAEAPDKIPTGYTGRTLTAYEEGMGWYAEVHNQVGACADALRITDAQMAGMAAACSANNVWETSNGKMPNLEMAYRVGSVLRADPEITISKADAEYWKGSQGRIEFGDSHFLDLDKEKGFAARQTTDISEFVGTRRLSELPDDVVARLCNTSFSQFSGSGSTTGWPNAERAIAIFRGADPANELDGMKIRSFYNSITSSGRSDDVVIDRHIMRVLTGDNKIDYNIISKPPAGKDTPYAEKLRAGRGDPFPNRTGWDQNAGSYPFWSDVIRDGAALHNMSPADYQAVVWYSQLADTPRVRGGGR